MLMIPTFMLMMLNLCKWWLCKSYIYTLASVTHIYVNDSYVYVSDNFVDNIQFFFPSIYQL